MFSVAERDALASYAPASGCDAQLNSWCDANCPHAETHGALLARRSSSAVGPALSWRCYAREALGEGARAYNYGSTYCTRDGQLTRLLASCLVEGANRSPAEQQPLPDTTVAVEASGETEKVPPPPPRVPPRSPTPATPATKAPEKWIDGPIPLETIRGAKKHGISGVRPPAPPTPAPHYEHKPELMVLSPRIPVPRLEDCSAELAAAATFLAVSMYTDAYAHKAAFLRVSCKAHAVCCSLSHVPNDAFGEGAEEAARRQTDGHLHESSVGKISNYFRHRLIASKPLFILRALAAASLPVAWLDVDLEFHRPPALFEPGAWTPPRDVLLWNWQANVTTFHGRRLKMASGVAFFNQTAAARALLQAWAEVMAHDANAASPDDQAMDLLVNDDGWLARCAWGWLPAAYLRMMPRHATALPSPSDAVLDHDRGAAPGRGNSAVKPVLPPRATPSLAD